MPEIRLFQNPQFGEIRTVIKDGEPWFKLSDVCKILTIGNSPDVAKRLDPDGIVKIDSGLINDLGGNINKISNYINESNLYFCIFQSNKPEAKRFQKWITSEVLPSIRKHGAYMTPDTIEKALTNPDFIIQLATKLKEERQKRLDAETARDRLIHHGKTYTATEIAKELNLKSAIQLNQILEEKKIQYKQNGTWVLYSEYAGNGYTSVKQEILENGRIIYDRRWTGKGRDFLMNILEEK